MNTEKSMCPDKWVGLSRSTCHNHLGLWVIFRNLHNILDIFHTWQNLHKHCEYRTQFKSVPEEPIYSLECNRPSPEYIVRRVVSTFAGVSIQWNTLEYPRSSEREKLTVSMNIMSFQSILVLYGSAVHAEVMCSRVHCRIRVIVITGVYVCVQ